MEEAATLILIGDAREQLRTLPERSVQTCITSPPYYGLRDYGMEGQLGLEATPAEYVQSLIDVFREVRRVLRDDGTVWLVLGDSYASSPPGIKSGARYTTSTLAGRAPGLSNDGKLAQATADKVDTSRLPGYKSKDLLGIPWMVAFALRGDGWYLRADIIWAKPNPMPESVTDRTTSSHEYVFLLAKQGSYFYDAEVIREDRADDRKTDGHLGENVRNVGGRTDGFTRPRGVDMTHLGGKRNRRSVWTVATKPYRDAHFAVFPPKLVEPMVLAGTPPKACGVCGAPWERELADREKVGLRRADHEYASPAAAEAGAVTGGPMGQYRKHGAELGRPAPATLGWQPTCDCECPGCHGEGWAIPALGAEDRPCQTCNGSGLPNTGQSIVLDPFCGTATTGEVAIQHGRSFVGIELNPDYAEMARRRLQGVTAPLFA